MSAYILRAFERSFLPGRRLKDPNDFNFQFKSWLRVTANHRSTQLCTVGRMLDWPRIRRRSAAHSSCNACMSTTPRYPGHSDASDER